MEVQKEVKKVAIIKLDNDYGGSRAWTIQESYNGEVSNPYSHTVMKREYFNQLQERIMYYLSEGFKVEIENY
jgi:hypothetical protein